MYERNQQRKHQHKITLYRREREGFVSKSILGIQGTKIVEMKSVYRSPTCDCIVSVEEKQLPVLLVDDSVISVLLDISIGNGRLLRVSVLLTITTLRAVYGV